MHAIIPQQVNAYRCKQSAKNMDVDKQDFYGNNDVTDEHAAAFERDYAIALDDHSIGRVIW